MGRIPPQRWRYGFRGLGQSRGPNYKGKGSKGLLEQCHDDHYREYNVYEEERLIDSLSEPAKGQNHEEAHGDYTLQNKRR